MNRIIIKDLEVFYHVGVPDEERATSQRLLITAELEHDFSEAARNDDLEKTINYFSITQRIQKFGEGRSWRLIEKLANDVADLILAEFQPCAVNVVIKKFIIPETRYVAVEMRKERADGPSA